MRLVVSAGTILFALFALIGASLPGIVFGIVLLFLVTVFNIGPARRGLHRRRQRQLAEAYYAPQRAKEQVELQWRGAAFNALHPEDWDWLESVGAGITRPAKARPPKPDRYLWMGHCRWCGKVAGHEVIQELGGAREDIWWCPDCGQLTVPSAEKVADMKRDRFAGRKVAPNLKKAMERDVPRETLKPPPESAQAPWVQPGYSRYHSPLPDNLQERREGGYRVFYRGTPPPLEDTGPDPEESLSWGKLNPPPTALEFNQATEAFHRLEIPPEEITFQAMLLYIIESRRIDPRWKR